MCASRTYHKNRTGYEYVWKSVGMWEYKIKTQKQERLFSRTVSIVYRLSWSTSQYTNHIAYVLRNSIYIAAPLAEAAGESCSQPQQKEFSIASPHRAAYQDREHGRIAQTRMFYSRVWYMRIYIYMYIYGYWKRILVLHSTYLLPRQSRCSNIRFVLFCRQARKSYTLFFSQANVCPPIGGSRRTAAVTLFCALLLDAIYRVSRTLLVSTLYYSHIARGRICRNERLWERKDGHGGERKKREHSAKIERRKRGRNALIKQARQQTL